MIPNDELQRILARQPFYRMQRFAALLGWRGLRLWHHRFRDEESQRGGLKTRIVIFYETTDELFNLQINQHPLGQTQNYRGTVKAERYGIVHVGWHDFELLEDFDSLHNEASRLESWLGRRHFRNKQLRKQYIAEHPEVPLYPTKKKRGRHGLLMNAEFQSRVAAWREQARSGTRFGPG